MAAVEDPAPRRRDGIGRRDDRRHAVQRAQRRERAKRHSGIASLTAVDLDLHSAGQQDRGTVLPARAGDFDALVAVLDPDVVFRIDRGRLAAAVRAPAVVRGADEVAQTVLARGTQFAPFARPAIVNGAAGLLVAPGARPIAVVGFTIAEGRIVEIDLIADPEKLRAFRTV